MSFYEWIEKDNITRFKIEDKELYYNAINNIKNSFTGRVDVRYLNNFILESAQLLINSICLMEMGYIDAAYYSLRTSLEVSVTIFYFLDFEDPETINHEISKWLKKKYFPTLTNILKDLSAKGKTYKEIQDLMPQYIEEFKNLNKRLNKYVHKQGFDNYYVCGRHRGKEQLNNNIQEFKSYLKSCIGFVGFFRLFIDAVPILLLDEEIYLRLPTMLMSDAYNIEFVNEYIGESIVSAYKKTSIYNGYYDYFIGFPKQPECISDIIQYQIIDTSKKDEILQYIDLIPTIEHKFFVLVALNITKITRGHSDFFYIYNTDREEPNDFFSIDYERMKSLEASPQLYNNYVETRFISLLSIPEHSIKIYVEHKTELTENEILTIDHLCKETLKYF